MIRFAGTDIESYLTKRSALYKLLAWLVLKLYTLENKAVTCRMILAPTAEYQRFSADFHETGSAAMPTSLKNQQSAIARTELRT